MAKAQVVAEADHSGQNAPERGADAIRKYVIPHPAGGFLIPDEKADAAYARRRADDQQQAVDDPHIHLPIIVPACCIPYPHRSSPA